MFKLYTLIAGVSVFIRQFFIDNPYESLPFLTQETELWLPEVLNWATEGAFHLITFAMVGIFYRSRSCPPLGSLLYLLFYWANTGVFTLMCKASFSVVPVVLIIIVYIVVIIGFIVLKNWIADKIEYSNRI